MAISGLIQLISDFNQKMNMWSLIKNLYAVFKVEPTTGKAILRNLTMAVVMILSVLRWSTAHAEDVSTCSTTAALCVAGCAVKGGLGDMLGKGGKSKECKLLCESDSKACMQRVTAGSGVPTSTNNPTPPSNPTGDRATENSTATASVIPQRLGVGELRLAPLTPKTKNIREVLYPTLDGIPVFLGATESNVVARFIRGYNDSFIKGYDTSLLSSANNRFPIADGVSQFFEVRRLLAWSENKTTKESNAYEVSLVMPKVLDSALIETYMICGNKFTTMPLPCKGGKQLYWKGETEFEQERNKKAFGAEAKPALFSAFGQKRFTFVLLEQLDLAQYDAKNEEFPFNTILRNRNLYPAPSSLDAGKPGVRMKFVVTPLRLNKAPPMAIKMPSAKAEEWVKSLMTQNRQDGVLGEKQGGTGRSVFTLTKVSCDVGEVGTFPNEIPCNLDAFEVYNDANYSVKAPL